MDRKLEELIADASKKLEEAQAARHAVLNYLEEEYDIEANDSNSYFENKCDWCYGLNTRKIEDAIEKVLES